MFEINDFPLQCQIWILNENKGKNPKNLSHITRSERMEELREELKNLDQDTERKRSGYKNLRRDIQEYRAKLNLLQV